MNYNAFVIIRCVCQAEKTDLGDVETQGSSYNAPRLHVAIEARKIVVSGEAAGLQIQLGPPAVPGRFDSCDLPPKCLF